MRVYFGGIFGIICTNKGKIFFHSVWHMQEWIYRWFCYDTKQQQQLLLHTYNQSLFHTFFFLLSNTEMSVDYSYCGSRPMNAFSILTYASGDL